MWRQILENGRSAFNDHWPYSALVPVGGAALCWMLCGRRKKTIEMGDGWWGPGEKPQKNEDTGVRPFRVEASEEDIKDLHARLDHTRYVFPLEDAQFHYGLPGTELQKIVSYWRNTYDWAQQVETINRYPHYKTRIEGLDVHFVHVKPPHLKPGQKAVPLLLVHGWPGSFYEFYRIIPLLTEPGNHGLDPSITFEVICPSIPGYGFSEAPHKKGFNANAVARIFYKLMLRLGFSEFYLQGGDWGSLITTTLSQMKPESVKGLHLNMVFINSAGLRMLLSVLLGRHLPWLVGFTREDVKRFFPYLEKSVYALVRESGYLHIQATKPDTVGSALNDSPAGLAAYILEKFSTWTNPDYRQLEDGGLQRKFTMDDLLNNVMIYWVTGSITSSMRFYKENLSREFQSSAAVTTPVYVPTGIAAFPSELSHCPQVLAKDKYKNIVSYTYMPRGGHFAAFEEPEILARDIQNFVSKVEKK
ncbi:epoxide hydrolase 1-like [Hyla sarda]|uniref:epoxide hydrolase 1-like n=1 Tax=Hyla sarda TaxID=327740 RepID=UPI0024C2D9A0|nr:epoxide hydrolase 1-like [Hyla sarda]XP_056424654.1 epoxide hydrolase 1-like [Hyla sarda]